MRDLPLNAMRAFASIYVEGGIRPAARALHITHSSVSRHLTELERWLGVELVDREGRTRPLTFTVEGRRLGEAVSRSFDDLANVVAVLRERHDGHAVVVDTTPSFAMCWLLPRLASFETIEPGIEVSVIVEQKRRAPRAGWRDVSIRMGRGPWPDGEVVPLMSDALFPVASPGYWRTRPKPRGSAQLLGHRLLHDRDPNASWAMWRERFGPRQLDVRQGRRFSSSDLVIRAAEQGLGIALARGRLVENSLANGTLQRAFDDRAIELPNAYWVLTEERERRRAVRAFVSWLFEAAAASGSP